MRQGSLCWLLAAGLLLSPVLQAQEDRSAAATTAPADGRLLELEQRLAASEQQSVALQAQLAGAGSQVLQALQLENRQLRQQLDQARALIEPPLMSDTQQWFVVGAITAVLSFLFGQALSRSSRQRRLWLN